MSYEELMKLSWNDLANLCKERGITVYKHKSKKTKSDLSNELVAYLGEHPELKIIVEEDDVESETETNVVEETIVECCEPEENAPWIMGNKDEVIENAQVGTLIAFIDEKGKPRSAKMVNRSSSRRVLKLVTEFDWEFIVPYEKVLWVKNGTRWPKGVYRMLKEYKNGYPINIAY